MRSYVIAGNWKMNAGANDGCELATNVARATEGLTKATVVVAPPFTALAAVSSDLAGTHVQVAGQNLYPKDNGAYSSRPVMVSQKRILPSREPVITVLPSGLNAAKKGSGIANVRSFWPVAASQRTPSES